MEKLLRNMKLHIAYKAMWRSEQNHIAHAVSQWLSRWGFKAMGLTWLKKVIWAQDILKRPPSTNQIHEMESSWLLSLETTKWQTLKKYSNSSMWQKVE